jgi:protein O-GlcNAc transferase
MSHFVSVRETFADVDRGGSSMLDNALVLISKGSQFAISLIRELTADDAPNIELMHSCALALAVNGQMDLAIRTLRDALHFDPARAGWYRDLGMMYAAVSDLGNARAAFAGALELQPRNEEYLVQLANVLLEADCPEESLSVYQRAREVAPQSSEVLTGLGRTLLALKRDGEAAIVLRKALKASPTNVSVRQILADAYRNLSFYDAALEQRGEVARLLPHDQDSTAALAVALCDVGDLEECIAVCEAVLRGVDVSPEFHSFYISALLHHSGSTKHLLQACVDWSMRHCAPTDDPQFENAPEPQRHLRIGYIVEGFDQPSANFLLPILLNHADSHISVFCFVTQNHNSASHALFDKSPVQLKDLTGLPPSESATVIRNEQIDILIDFGWSRRYHHLLIFHHRAAPLQVEIPNYPCTTGLSATDYLLTDDLHSPPGTASQYIERLIRIPSGYMPYAPPLDAPPVSECPALRTGHITYGLFQRPAKLSAVVWDDVAAILVRCPAATLLIHQASRDLDSAASRSCEQMTGKLEDRGIHADRIHFTGLRPIDKHLSVLAEADIALDTFPYSGTTTSCECLWMGVPIVTLAGDNHASRVTAGFLERLELGHLVTHSHDEYIQKAVDLATDPRRLNALRMGLRQRMRKSPITDSSTLTRNLESVYRRIWQEWCCKQGS